MGKQPLRVLFATAELAPLVRVGGLGEVAGGLTKALRGLGVEVQVCLPDYFATTLKNEIAATINVPEWVGEATARTGDLAGFGEVTLIGVPEIRRLGPYGDPGQSGYWDNDRRFFGFSAAVAALANETQPDILHVNDWHTGAALAWVDDSIRSVASIHNLAYQGDADHGWLAVFGDRRDAYDRGLRCNPLAGALALADRVVAVSPTYAKEILTPAAGCGLETLLAAKAGQVVGIINGIDHEEWDSTIDRAIATPFGGSLGMGGKAVCRTALREQVGLPEASGPVFGFVTRLADQKGVEFVIEAGEFLESMDGQLVVLGSGDRALADSLHALAARHPTRVAFREGFDLALSHRIFAGADCYVMPSRFEPCGLAQMQAMAYGTVPVVTNVGGLQDTVTDVTRSPLSGTGFVSRQVSTAGLVDAMHRATAAFATPSVWKDVQSRGMTFDWSWATPAGQYLSMYASLLQTA
jgi:starch synthase